jgi:hypothetical protein
MCALWLYSTLSVTLHPQHEDVSLLCCVQVWKIKRFSGAAEHSLRAEVTMVSTTKERKPWARPPISMNFQVCSPK